MKLSINEPCNEDWNNMKIGMFSRHCEKCEKKVMDFTTMSRTEIISYLLNNTSESICGRMKTTQLDFHQEDFPIIIEVLKKSKNPHSFLILSLICLTLISCEPNNKNDQNNSRNSNDIETTTGEVAIDTSNIEVLGKINSNYNSKKEINQSKMKEELLMGDCIIQPEIEVQGMIAYQPDIKQQENDSTVLKFAEKMPEFNGGINALFDYIQKNVIYPEYENNNNIEGTVYVRFIVDRNGKIVKPTILKSVSGSINFDTEAIKVINNMPNWIPGENNGEKVNVEYNLPIRFKK
jgi:TonB family protein